ncbi:MAG: hypothetical protein GXY38_01005 [Planctomycetes bacterium]|jgi:membrane protease subunit HflC|nr:hypothetical protein [Planctomycetota bacterium]
MKKHLGMMVLGAVVVGALGVFTVAFQVGELTDLVLVTTWGKATDTYSGRDADQAGLRFKWPYPVQETVRYDARTFLFEDTHEQVQTADKQHVLVTMFCAWRIDDAADFYGKIKTVDAAQAALKSLLRDVKVTSVTRRSLDRLINTDPSRIELDEVEREVLAAMADKARQDYGVEVVMVGVKNLGLPKSVTETVIESMKEERRMKVQEYETRGNAYATAIRERARAASEKIRAFSGAKASVIRGEGDAAAAAYYARFGEHEELAKFLRNLESLKITLQQRTVILLDESIFPMIKQFRQDGQTSLAPQSPSQAGKSSTK